MADLKNNKNKQMFQNRLDAGLQLAKKLKKFRNSDAIILAIPRGGVPVAYAVSKELNIPVDIILTKKIGHPDNKEFAIGAASLSDHFILPSHSISAEYLAENLKIIREKLKKMATKYGPAINNIDLQNKTVIVIDDGIATGNTILATISLLEKEKPKQIIIAVPAASENAIKLLSKKNEEIITVIISDNFRSVSQFYEDFTQVTDEEVIFYLNKTKVRNIQQKY